jgi:D-alanyl-D-alanine carboxypeptidase/D-alanyl-D-alanine-endopeptidase (penicillin-binding protein 4)
MMKRYVLILAGFLAACSPVSKTVLNKKFHALEEKLQDHTGFMLYDLEKKKELYSFQSGQYFTPASNTKMFTFFTALTVLGDSIPALQYIEKGDSLIFKGTGDPSFLYSEAFDSRRAFDFLQASAKKLYLAEDNFFTSQLGPGWAWSDYHYTYSSERSAFPVYGNFFSVKHTGKSLNVRPQLFAYNIVVADSVEESDLVRDIGSNKITFNPGRKFTKAELWEVPFKTDITLTAALLTDTLKKKVNVVNHVVWDSVKTIYSVPADSLYKTMIQQSDNFIAEQLLLVCSDVLSDSLQPEIAIDFMKKNYLKDLPDKPIWVDGSGLSRFNLFTPRSMVKLWEKLYETVPRERLFALLAIGGKAGTIRNSYKNDPPYIYGKTGTLANNHSLSGYLITKGGKTLIFSFMSNNHPVPAREVRSEMEIILKSIYEKY